MSNLPSRRLLGFHQKDFFLSRCLVLLQELKKKNKSDGFLPQLHSCQYTIYWKLVFFRWLILSSTFHHQELDELTGFWCCLLHSPAPVTPPPEVVSSWAAHPELVLGVRVQFIQLSCVSWRFPTRHGDILLLEIYRNWHDTCFFFFFFF